LFATGGFESKLVGVCTVGVILFEVLEPPKPLGIGFTPLPLPLVIPVKAAWPEGIFPEEVAALSWLGL